jgi:hypothetical protein
MMRPIVARAMKCPPAARADVIRPDDQHFLHRRVEVHHVLRRLLLTPPLFG